MSTTIERINRHLRQLAPHQRERDSATLLVEARDRVVELERTNAMLTDLRYELMGIAADVDSGNGFDSVCRDTLQRVIDKLAVTTGSEEWLQQQINEALGDPVGYFEVYNGDSYIQIKPEFADETSIKLFRHPEPLATVEDRLREGRI